MRTYRPMVPVFVCFSLGILLDYFWKVPLIWPVAAFVVATVTAFIPLVRRISVWILILMAGYLIADCDVRLSDNDISRMTFHNRDVAVQGIIVSDVETRRVLKADKTIFYLQVERVLSDGHWRPSSGRIMVNSFIHQPVMFGQRLILQGRLHAPFDFGDPQKSSYSDYLSRRHVQYVLTSGKDDQLRIIEKSVFPAWRMMLRRLHADWPKMMDRYLSPGESGIMTAMMTGDRSRIPPHIKQLFVETGTVHILAISGLNMAIIAAVFLWMAQLLPVGFRWRILIGLLMVIAYAVLTDGEASIVRSAIMASVVLSGLILEKEQDGLNTLALSALIILVIAPWQLFDLGFQLTFLCVWTMIVVHPMFKDVCVNIMNRVGAIHELPLRNTTTFFHENPIGRSMMDSISISLTISIVVSGLIAYHFQIVTPVTVLANVIVVPLTTFVIVAGMALGFCAVAIPAAAPVAAVYVKIILNSMIVLIYLLRQLPGACVYLKNFSALDLMVYFLLIIVIIGLARWIASSRARFS